MKSIVLATEDVLSEQAGLRLAEEAGLQVVQQLRRGGNGYLRSRIGNFCQMASFQTVLVISDLDQVQCPSKLLTDWLGAREKPTGLLIRVAVREIESWILADHQAMRKMLGNRIGNLPREPELLKDPKNTLLNLARRAPRSVREDLLPKSRSIASKGLGYNSRLSSLIRTAWSPTRAAERSLSLRRARERLRELARQSRKGLG